jgi:hypothetical protein
MAKYYIAKDDLESALEWLEEVHVLYQNLYFKEWEKPLYGTLFLPFSPASSPGLNTERRNVK